MNASVPFILTNHPGRDKSKTWATATHYLERKSSYSYAFINNLATAIGMFRRRRQYEIVVLGGGAQVDMLYMILQRLWPFSPRPIVKIDCLWYRSPPIRHFIKKMLSRWVNKVVSRYVVWASREIKDYSKAFGITRNKFFFLPYHTTVDLSGVRIKRGDYVFSGGNFARDYSTLARAVEGLDARVVVACTNRRELDGIEFPENVEIVGVSHRNFMRLMAQSGINVVVLKKGLLHSGGQQTFLNAMAMGKAVIVTDPEGARDYIDDGVDGVLVPPSDPVRLRSAIVGLLRHPGKADNLGRAAREKASNWDTEAHLTAIATLCEKIIKDQAILSNQ